MTISPKILNELKTPQNTTRLYLQVADKIAQLIKNKNLLPGQRLPAERELSSSFDVSRQTIREALIALEISGLVEIRPGSGVYILKSDTIKSSLIAEDAPGPLEIMEARAVLESEACKLAAVRISNEELLRLKSYLVHMDNLLQQDLYDEVEKFDRKFHIQIAQASKNSAILTMVEWLWDLRDSSEVSRVFDKKIREYGATSNRESHIKILESLTQRNGDGASEAMKSHLEDVANTYVVLVSN